MTVFLITAFTTMVFAANSLLCRMAAGAERIDPMSCTNVRLVSGAQALIPISRMAGKSKAPRNSSQSWGSGFALFTCAATFSLAYVSAKHRGGCPDSLRGGAGEDDRSGNQIG